MHGNQIHNHLSTTCPRRAVVDHIRSCTRNNFNTPKYFAEGEHHHLGGKGLVCTAIKSTIIVDRRCDGRRGEAR
jgi:hypothetical protein